MPGCTLLSYAHQVLGCLLHVATQARTTSLTPAAGQQLGNVPAAAAAGAADAPTGPTPRSKPAVAKGHKLQMLGDDEQEEMNKLIKQQSARKKDVGHG